MTHYNEVSGDLIDLAKKGNFDVIAHGCNCFCTMGAGIAPQMASAFGCDDFPLEDIKYSGVQSKLGKIDYKTLDVNGKELIVVNAYTQYGFGGKPFDYDAFEKIVFKMNHDFKGKHIGLPKIGAGLAGGNWSVIKDIIKEGFIDCKVTIVNYRKR
jgi:O-acetyl-ADP-ribose deacetylase (regulator of RNase III)